MGTLPKFSITTYALRHFFRRKSRQELGHNEEKFLGSDKIIIQRPYLACFTHDRDNKVGTDDKPNCWTVEMIMAKTSFQHDQAKRFSRKDFKKTEKYVV